MNTKLSRFDQKASATSGALDLELPEQKLRDRLSMERERTDFDTDAVLKQLAQLVGWARLEPESPSMKPSEVRQQAEATVKIIDELLVRFGHMHPTLTMRLDEMLYKAFGQFAHNLTDQLEPGLHRMRAALRRAAADMAKEPSRPGPRGNWPALRDRVAELLRANSEPPVNKRESKALAADLLELCDLAK